MGQSQSDLNDDSLPPLVDSLPAAEDGVKLIQLTDSDH